MTSVFYSALSNALADGPFSVEKDESADSMTLRTTDGSNLTLSAASGDTDNDATISLSALSGTTSDTGDTTLEFTDVTSDGVTFNSVTTGDDRLDVSIPGTGNTAVEGSTVAVNEISSTTADVKTAAVTTGTLTIYMDPDMVLTSDSLAPEGLFGTAGTAVTGSSILTLGGNNGFDNFDAGDKISFDVDGNTVSFEVSSADGGTTDAGIAQQLFDALDSDITSSNYSFVLNGTSVSILKNADLEDPIEITDFTDSNLDESMAADASMTVSTGTGEGTAEPENNRLESGNEYRDSATSSLYEDEGIILWEKLDENGNITGDSGLITVEDKGTVFITEQGSQTLSFDLSSGTLVAGNTLTINTDASGSPDPLDFEIFRQANSINDTYHFKVISGGSVGHLPEDGQETLTIQWASSVSSGTFEIEGHDPPETPVPVEVDGMLLNFYGGSLFSGDVFTITTDESGQPVTQDDSGNYTGELMSDWHWTLDSFADEFNRNGAGMTAAVTNDNQLLFEQDSTYAALDNITWSGTSGFSEDNAAITVLNHTALDFTALDMQFVRSSGLWGIVNDATGGISKIIPEGGDDNRFKVDLNGDGLGDIEINFSSPVTGDGSVSFDLIMKDPSDINYTLGDSALEDCGLLAAAGINSFFTGEDALNIDVNSIVSDTSRIGAGIIDSETGIISQGDNQNALAMSNIQHEILPLKQWEFVRGQDATSSIVDTTLDDYYNAMIGSLGITSRSITSSREFADIMVNQLTEKRDAVSAVSLDEEMIKLMEYQNAYTAASKLLTVADEMLQTLLAVR